MAKGRSRDQVEKYVQVVKGLGRVRGPSRTILAQPG